MSKNRDREGAIARAGSAKKLRYETPKLERYGKVAELTRTTVASGSKNDHTGGPVKTA
jgi:hypothetical protein